MAKKDSTTKAYEAYLKDQAAKEKVYKLYESFARHYKTMQEEWVKLDGDEKAFKKAGVWGMYKKLGSIVDDEGPIMKKFVQVINKVGLRLP